jgi:hypothetical protein
MKFLFKDLRIMETGVFFKKFTEIVNNHASDNATLIFIDLNEDPFAHENLIN